MQVTFGCFNIKMSQYFFYAVTPLLVSEELSSLLNLAEH